MMLSLAILLSTAWLVDAYSTDCTTNVKGDYYCNQRINYIKTLPGFNASNPANPIDGNLCTTWSADYGLFRWELCCLACKNLLGGSIEAMKEDVYVNTKAGETCKDDPAAQALCAKTAYMTPANKATFCSQASGRQYCSFTCGLCTTQPTQLTTARACDSTMKCTNQTTCNRYNMTTYQCTSDGTATGVVNGGTCNCLGTCGKVGLPCTNDTACGGYEHSCQATKGKCVCPQCRPMAVCLSDNDCGGYVGACGNIVAGVFTGITTDGIAIGKCLACPGSSPCKNDALACTPTDAVQVCGHAEYCVAGTAKDLLDPAFNSHKCLTGDTGCVCACKTFVAIDGTAWAPEANTEAPVCIEGVFCGTDVTASLQLCGYKSACRNIDGLPCPPGTAATTGACTCQCTNIPTMGAPNVCLGASTRADGSPAACTLAVVADFAGILNTIQPDSNVCGFKAGTDKIPPYLWKDACAPDMSTGVCSCAISQSPVYTSAPAAPTLTVSCLVSTECRSIDGSSVCATIGTAFGLGVGDPDGTICTQTLASAGLCACVPANALLIEPDTWKCIIDDDCGWGSCMADASGLAPCTMTDRATSTCRCIPAGCKHGRLCGINYSEEDCGGVDNVCEGKCSCT